MAPRNRKYSTPPISRTKFHNHNQAAGGRDAFCNGNKFITPLVVNRNVDIGTLNGVAIFGLLCLIFISQPDSRGVQSPGL